jgi:hypothetical protein
MRIAPVVGVDFPLRHNAALLEDRSITRLPGDIREALSLDRASIGTME